MERYFFKDPLVLAVVFNEYEKAKELLESGAYNDGVFSDIGMEKYFGIPIPIQYISRCWEICFWQDFREPFAQITRPNYENAKKILSLIKEKKGINAIEIPFSKIPPALWAREDESDEEILEGKKSDFISNGARKIDLDLNVAVKRMDFKAAKELLENGANPCYKHCADCDEDLFDLCGGECSYQAGCQAGFLIESPDYFRNSIDYDEIGSIFRWAANEAMYELLDSYRKAKEAAN